MMMTADHFLFYCDIFVECREHEYECITFDDDAKRKERDRNGRKMTTDRYFFFDSSFLTGFFDV